MRLIGMARLDDFSKGHADARAAVEKWATMVQAANWSSMDDVVRSAGRKPSPVSHKQVVFNIKGNDYRLIASIDFERKAVQVKWIGTHGEYNKIDAAQV